MNQLLLNLPLERKRDLFLARQRGRQLAALLGYERDRQVSIAAAVFEIATQVCGRPDARLRLQINGASFQVYGLPRSALRLDVPLPRTAAKLDPADLAWAVQQLELHTPLNVLEEVRLQNQELLQALQELQAAQRELMSLRGGRLRPAA